jgi:hypothetical protein
MLKSNSDDKSEPKGTGWEITLKAFDPQNVQSNIPILSTDLMENQISNLPEKCYM